MVKIVILQGDIMMDFVINLATKQVIQQSLGKKIKPLHLSLLLTLSNLPNCLFGVVSRTRQASTPTH